MRMLLIVLGLTAHMLIAAHPAHAQTGTRLPRIGFLSSIPPGHLVVDDWLREGLKEFGYIEGKNVVLEIRHAEIRDASASTERLRELARELVRLKVDVLVTSGADSCAAAQLATTTIPIVGGLGANPVRAGLVTNLARPGGNTTGVSTMQAALSRKRLELLNEIAPKISPVALLWYPGTTSASGNRLIKSETERAARELSLDLQSVPVDQADQFENAFAAIKTAGARSLIVSSAPLFVAEERQILDLATKSRLPAIYPGSDWVDAGGLMSYGPNYKVYYKRIAYYVNRILKGAKPADLPVEQPTQFDLVINLKTARQFGLTIPEAVLDRADRVVE